MRKRWAIAGAFPLIAAVAPVGGGWTQPVAEIEEIVVTGSRIRRDPLSESAPLMAIGADALERTGPYESRRRAAGASHYRVRAELPVQRSGQLRIPPGRRRHRRGFRAGFAAERGVKTYAGAGRWTALDRRRFGLRSTRSRRSQFDPGQRDRPRGDPAGRCLRNLRLRRDRRGRQHHHRPGIQRIQGRPAVGRLSRRGATANPPKQA